MPYIKWKKGNPYVYRSERGVKFSVAPDGTVMEQDVVKSVYLGTYRSYRKKRPNGVFDTLIPPETRLKMLSKHSERITMLRNIDEEVYRAFEKARS